MEQPTKLDKNGEFEEESKDPRKKKVNINPAEVDLTVLDDEGSEDLDVVEDAQLAEEGRALIV